MNNILESTEQQKNSFLKLNWVEVIVLLALFMVGNLVFGGIGMAISTLFTNSREIYFLTLPIFWVLPFVTAFFLFYLLFMKNKSERYHLTFIPNFWGDIPVYLGIFVGLFLVNEYLTGLIPTDVGILKDLYKLVSDVFLELKEYPITMTFMIVVLAPIFEEILFRGIILKGLLNNGVKPILAIVVQGLLFGLVHANPWQFVGATLLGIFFGWVYYNTKSLFHTMFLHFVNNALGCYFIFEFGMIDFADISIYTAESLLLIGLIISALFCFIYYKMSKNRTWNLC